MLLLRQPLEDPVDQVPMVRCGLMAEDILTEGEYVS